MAFQFGIGILSIAHLLRRKCFAIAVLRQPQRACLTDTRLSCAQIVPTAPTTSDKQINVNWLYGLTSRTVQLRSLSRDERLKLYVRQTYMTPGIYIKTTIFAVHDQITNSNPGWGGGSRRSATSIHYSEFGDVCGDAGSVEPRYDPVAVIDCGLARVMRSCEIVTYDRTEKSLRPQIMPYLAPSVELLSPQGGSRNPLGSERISSSHHTSLCRHGHQLLANSRLRSSALFAKKERRTDACSYRSDSPFRRLFRLSASAPAKIADHFQNNGTKKVLLPRDVSCTVRWSSRCDISLRSIVNSNPRAHATRIDERILSNDEPGERTRNGCCSGW